MKIYILDTRINDVSKNLTLVLHISISLTASFLQYIFPKHNIVFLTKYNAPSENDFAQFESKHKFIIQITNEFSSISH